jgi:quinol monooxygenase YgiN
MLPARLLFVAAALIPSLFFGQTPTPAPVDGAFYAVAYVESKADAAKAARATLEHYRDASRKHDGLVREEFFEQIGRPGHFAVVETWRDQRAFETRDAAAARQLVDALQPIRVSDYDQRPYKTLTVAPVVASTSRQAVYVITHVDVTPNPLVPPMLKRLAENSRQEAGNLRFDVLQSTVRANHFTVIEAWRTSQALAAHVAAAHTRQYRDELGPLTGSPLDERVYSGVE